MTRGKRAYLLALAYRALCGTCGLHPCSYLGRGFRRECGFCQERRVVGHRIGRGPHVRTEENDLRVLAAALKVKER